MQTTAPTPTGRGAPGQNRVCVRRTPSAGVSYGRHNRLSGLARASGTGPGASRPAGKPVQQVAASPLPADAAAVRAGLTDPVNLGIAAGVGLAGYGLYKLFDTPSRPYQNNVGQEYDAWTEEGILEYYWGEHIHLGYYNKEEMAAGYKKKNFIQAKYDFVDEMLAFSGAALPPPTVLDVGCGIGGTTRHLAAKFPTSKLTGITLSPNQVKRATELAAKRGLSNVNFRVRHPALGSRAHNSAGDRALACFARPVSSLGNLRHSSATSTPGLV